MQWDWSQTLFSDAQWQARSLWAHGDTAGSFWAPGATCHTVKVYRLPRVVGESSCLQIFQSLLDMVLGSWLWVVLLDQRIWTRWLPEVLFIPNFLLIFSYGRNSCAVSSMHCFLYKEFSLEDMFLLHQGSNLDPAQVLCVFVYFSHKNKQTKTNSREGLYYLLCVLLYFSCDEPILVFLVRV